MGNILLVIIIAIVIWMFNPLLHSSLKPSSGVDKKTINEINQIKNEAIQQVNQARQLQQQEQDTLNN